MEKKYIIMLRIASVVLIVLLGAIAYLSVSVNPKSVFIASINNSYTQMSEMVDQLRESRFATLSRENPVLLTAQVDFEFEHSDGLQEMEMIGDILENLEINYTVDQDLQNKKLYMDIRALLENEKILGGNIFAEDGITYFFIQEFFDHYVGVDDFDLFQEDDRDVIEMADDIEVVTEKVKTLFLKSLKTDYFTSEKLDITLNGEEISVTKNTFDLNSERIKEMLEYVIKGLKDDEKAIEAIKNITSYSSEEPLTSEEIIAELDNALAEIPNLDLEGFEMSYSIYVKGLLNKIVKHDLLFSYNNGQNQTLNIVSYDKDDVSILELHVDGKKVFSLEFLGNEDNSSKVGMFIYENNEQTFAIELEMTSEETEIEKDKYYSNDFKLNLKITMEEENITLGINALTELEVREKIYEPGRSVLIKEEDMTSEQRQKIEQAMEELLAGIGQMLFSSDLGAVEDAERGVFDALGNGVLKAAENEYMRSALDGEIIEISYEFKSDGTNIGTNGNSLSISGEAPTIGSLIIDEAGLIYMAVSNGTYCSVSAGNRGEVATYDEYELISQYAVGSINDCSVEGLNLRPTINSLHFER